MGLTASPFLPALSRGRAAERSRPSRASRGIVNDKYLVVLPNYLYAFDLTVWGVIHLLVGLALVVIGVSLLRVRRGLAVAGMIAAAVSAILNFVWLPISPWWAIVLIAIDMLVIWALAQYPAQPTLTPSQDTQDRQAAMS